MVGLVISDTFILTGSWEISNHVPTASGIAELPLTEPIINLIHDESELNSVLASALRQAKEINSFVGKDVLVGLPDSFVNHSIVPIEKDLSKDDHLNYINWLESKKKYSSNHSFYTFGQIYLPAEKNIHVCTVSRSLVRTLKLTIEEMGGIPKWMGPVSSMFLDGSGISEAAMIHRDGNKYSFMKVQNNIFGMGAVTFSGGVAKIASTSDDSDEVTLSALGLEKSDLDDIPVFCPQKLGRQAKRAWELSDFRMIIPLDGVAVEGRPEKLPYYETNILTKMIHTKTLDKSFNFFKEPGITEFFFTEVLSSDHTLNETEEVDEKSTHQTQSIDVSTDKVDEKSSSSMGIAFAIILIVSGFIGFNYLKLQDELNNSFFGINDKFEVRRSGVDENTEILKTEKSPPIDLIKQSRSISSAIITLLTETDINRYNALTITKSFLSLEYLSGDNPNIENILDAEPTSFSVEAAGKDSTIFLWYYSFDLPVLDAIPAAGNLSKLDLLVQMDTTLTDYNLKYFEQVFTKNQIYGPLLVWVRGKADILQASAIISNVDDSIMLRKFVLFNKSDKPNPRAGFYVSILED